MTAKEEILSRIAQAKVAPTYAERADLPPTQRTRTEVIEQFAEYAADYKATVSRTTRADLERVLAEKLSGSVLAPADLPQEWSPQAVRDAGLSIEEIDSFDCVVTGCAIAIAETGTIVLDGGFAQGRRALSLVPDHHVCVVFEDQILDTLPEAVAALDGKRPLTWISGPSATSDIELSRVEGVHGPRRLDIVIVA